MGIRAFYQVDNNYNFINTSADVVGISRIFTDTGGLTNEANSLSFCIPETEFISFVKIYSEHNNAGTGTSNSSYIQYHNVIGVKQIMSMNVSGTNNFERDGHLKVVFIGPGNDKNIYITTNNVGSPTYYTSIEGVILKFIK